MGDDVSDLIPTATTIEGRYGNLRPLSAERDGPTLFALSHNQQIDPTWAEMKVGPFETEAAFVAHVSELVSDPKRTFFAVTNTRDAVLGWLCLMEARAAHKVIEIGYVLFTPTMQRTTLATEALYLAMRHVFETLGYRRLEWTCTAANARSRRSADRLGFTFEGVLREGLILKGRPRDICMYSLLHSEWLNVRSALEAWLDPANFDGGKQKMSVAALRTDRASIETVHATGGATHS